MEASDQLAELTESVTSLREDVKRADDTIAGVGDTFREFIRFYSTQSHASERIRSRVTDIDAKLAKHDERFDRIDEVLRQILDKVG